MGTNVAPILPNLYLASKTGKNCEGKNQTDPKLIWPKVFKRYIDDGFGITKGSRKDVEDWISEFNNLVESIRIDKFKYGPRVEYMDLVIFKGNRFHEKGFLISKYIRKSRIFKLTSRKKVFTENMLSKTMC